MYILFIITALNTWTLPYHLKTLEECETLAKQMHQLSPNEKFYTECEPLD